MDVIAFLEKPAREAGAAVRAPRGRTFLKRQALLAFEIFALGGRRSRPVSTCNGDKATLARCFDELDTLPSFFHGGWWWWTTPTCS